MKQPKNDHKLKVAKAQQSASLTPGDLRGIAAAEQFVQRLKSEYAQGVKPVPMDVHVSVMAGPTKKA